MNKKDKIGIIVKLCDKEFRVLLSSLYEEKMNLLRDQYKYNSLIEEALTKIEGIINKIK